MDRNELNQMSASYLNVTVEGVSFWAAGLWDRLRIPPVALRGSNANPCVLVLSRGGSIANPALCCFSEKQKFLFETL